MAALFATTLFLSALLLFWVQPMVAKILLPWLGGTPAVWNTCMVFFQAMLLAGYAYAHWTGRHLSLARQVLVQVSLLTVAALVLPISLPEWTLRFLPAQANPTAWLLGSLLLSAGVPFFAVASNGPLLQHWFSRSRHTQAGDPYFLYAASNLGSLVALLGYPLLLEPRWRLGQQSRGWSALFGALIVLILTCGLVLLRTRRVACAAHPAGASESAGDRGEQFEAVCSRRPWRWCLLAFVPSSLMLGVTTYLTTDIASVPLLWVAPLAIYLLTFVLVFGRTSFWRGRWVFRLLPIAAIGLAYMLVSEATQPAWMLLPLHLLVFFVAALACHGRLAQERPPAAHLTEYYLWISFGGVLGGLFNALAAPLLFTRVTEYPLALVLACCLRPSLQPLPQPSRPWLDMMAPAGVALLAGLAWALSSHLGALPLQARLGVAGGVPLLICYTMVDRPIRFALCLAGVLLASAFAPGSHGRPLHVERNFFGVLRVTRDPLGPFYRLVHGNTIHGRQWIDPARRSEPLSYYHRRGPLGEIFAFRDAQLEGANIGVVGLGAGAMAGYAKPGQTWTFYEINPAVLRVARNPSFFTFLRDCPADWQVLLGDARLRLREAPDHHYRLLVLDAFSSDSIPLHLVTREALKLYLAKLAPDGWLVFHISNRCLNLETPLGDLAKDAHLFCRARQDPDPDAAQLAEGLDQSHWLVMARRPADFGKLTKSSRWLPIDRSAQRHVWTDDFADIVSVFEWR